MRKKRNYKLIIFVFIAIFLSFIVFLFNKNKISYNNSILILNKKGEKYEYSDVNYEVLYGTVMVPINEIFKGLFGEQFIENINQTINYKEMQLIINYDKGTISIPKLYEANSGFTIDNSVEVEIENLNNQKYIPLYLITSLPDVTVKIDNTSIYNPKQYVNSYIAINNNNNHHNIEINVESEKDNINVTYYGQEDGALWREEAIKRIEKYRKKDIKFLVENQDKNIIYNYSSDIKIINNSFRFGTSIAYGDEQKIIDSPYFNILGEENNLKWSFLEKYPNNVTYSTNIIKNSIKKEKVFRGHCIWWDSNCSQIFNSIIGSKESTETNTMYYLYKSYNEGSITIEKARSILKTIKRNFENIIFNHIDYMLDTFSDVSEWDVLNEIITSQYFKHYLYDEYCLTSDNFMYETKYNDTTIINNEEYKEFLAKCFDRCRQKNKNTKLVYNENSINGYINYPRTNELINLVKGIKQYTSNIDKIGIQFHNNTNYLFSPQSYYNSINRFSIETKTNDFAITEYDNCTSSKIGNYTKNEKRIKAKYLIDNLIMAYSNPKISEFSTWVITSSRFEDEERQAYEEFVTPLLNYTETGTSNENGYQTRLHKGDYTATITLPNGKSKTINFTVSDDSSDAVEVVFESEVENIKVTNNPNKTVYYQGDNLNLDGGKITAYYDDETNMEIDMTNSDVSISGYDKNKIGKQTITVTYNGKTTTFDIEVKKDITEDVKKALNSIKSKNQLIFVNNEKLNADENIKQYYVQLINTCDTLLSNVSSINKNNVIDIFNYQIDMAKIVVNEMTNKKISLTDAELLNALSSITSITDEYGKLFEYYVISDDMQGDTVKNTLNDTISKYNANVNIDISNTTDLIEQCKDLYENSINTDNQATNYLNKLKIIKTCEVASKIIDYDVELYNSQSQNDQNNSEEQNNNTNENTVTNSDQPSISEQAENTTTSSSSSQSQQEQPKETMKGNVYRIEDNFIKNTARSTTPIMLLNNLGLRDNFFVYRGGHVLTDTFAIATGDILQFYDQFFTLSVLGDINQDTWVNVRDLVRFRKVLLGSEQLNQAETYAADINQDNKVNVSDLIEIRKILLE